MNRAAKKIRADADASDAEQQIVNHIGFLKREITELPETKFSQLINSVKGDDAAYNAICQPENFFRLHNLFLLRLVVQKSNFVLQIFYFLAQSR